MNGSVEIRSQVMDNTKEVGPKAHSRSLAIIYIPEGEVSLLS